MKAQIATDHKSDIFIAGAIAAGFDVCDIPKPTPDDILVVWNRKPSNIDLVNRFERAGARVFVAENGYIGTDKDGGRLIALALSRHSGAGRWPTGQERRYREQNFDIMPSWRTERGNEVVILAQRGIGETAQTHDWSERLAKTLRGLNPKRKIRIRAHPGKEWKDSPIAQDLLQAHAVVTWSSGAAIKAIAFGVPCFHLMPGWIGELASVYGIDDLEKPYLGKRQPMFQRLSWAQWSEEEISNGKAFAAFAGMK